MVLNNINDCLTVYNHLIWRKTSSYMHNLITVRVTQTNAIITMQCLRKKVKQSTK